MPLTPLTRFLRSALAPLAVAAFVGFSVGLLFAAVVFPPRIERITVSAPAPAPEPVAPAPEPTPPDVWYQPVAFADLPNWSADSVAAAHPAMANACAVFAGMAAGTAIGPEGLGGTAGDWQTACDALGTITADAQDADDAMRQWLTAHFTVYAVETPGGPEGTFTGYYEASLNGALTPSDRFSVPLYAPPRDLVELDRRAFDLPSDVPAIVGQVNGRRLVPYDARRDIEDSGAFGERADVLVWVDDPVDAHLLHIQGSGRVRLPDGSSRRIGYAGNNGWRFRGIGGILLSAGVLGPGQGSMPSVAAWLRDNPEAGRRFMADNPRFIFFRWIDGPGPIGAFGTALVPRRSLAVDPRYIPYGAPLWLDVDDPDGEPLDGLVVALDTGSAIRGAVRGDFFWGAGEAAFDKAGRMKSAGRYFLMLPRTVTPPSGPS